MNFSEWANKIYGEEDFGRSISTTLSGIVGLSTYLVSKDWVLSLFVTVIVFPLLRLIASAAHTRWKKAKKQRLQTLEAHKSFEKFSLEEKKVLRAFVNAGGAALSYSQINRADVARSAVESLVLRGILSNTILSDCATEAFVLETEVFDMAQQVFSAVPSSRALATSPDSDEVSF
ncbi:MAG: hypothetical protein V7609_2743 [Verrucomicrobiota bacterium]